MRRIITALAVLTAMLVIAPAANAASSQQILTLDFPTVTDSLGGMHAMRANYTYTQPAAGEENCAYYNLQYRALGATDALGETWRDAYMYHGSQPRVPLDDAWGASYGVKTVQVRLNPTCNPASKVFTRSIRYLRPHSLDPLVSKVTVPTTVTGDTVSVAIVAKSGAYDVPTPLRVRFATENGDWVAPQTTKGYAEYPAYQPVMTAPVSAGTGAKGLFVMVIDGLRDSNIYYVRFTRTKAAPPSAPGNNAPVLTAISTPATVTGSAVTVTVKASDDNAVKRIRFATEAGTWGAWQACSGATYSAPVSAGNGYKGVFVQVQDAGYATSSILYRTFTRVS
ncbi:MAG: hypothetical protein H7288_06225 [Kineosporiaceae bacterium]|nr:hypothetical protein [Aeromicrobium sp.]